jgi:hypothetical protein
MDFVVLGDSMHGPQVVVSPNLRSIQGRDSVGAFVTLALEPTATRRWAAGVTAVVESVSAMARRDRTPFETIPLVANRGRARVVVSMARDAPRATPFVLLVVDTASRGWTVKASRDDLRLLLTAFDVISGASAIDSGSRATGGPYLECELDERPQPPEHFPLRYPLTALRDRREGRVLAKFVIDSTGAVPADSLVILLSDGESFTAAVRQALPRVAYTPGRRGGRAVNAVVWEWFAFRFRETLPKGARVR